MGKSARLIALLVCSGWLSTASNSAELEHAPPAWRGVWVLDRDAGASAISALDSAQVRALLGSTLSLDGGAAALGTTACPSPGYQVSSESTDAFASDFRIRAADVGITENPVKVLQVSCGSYAYDLILLGTGRGLVIYQGHFFGAAKRIGQ
jgi:hypothetical protein